MTNSWDPRAKPPPSVKEDALSYVRWFLADLAAFQQEYPDFPQRDVSKLPVRKREQVVKAWNHAREAAELEDAEKDSPEYAAIVERFYRTRIISSTLPRRRKTQFYVTDRASAIRAMESASSQTAITISGTVSGALGATVQEFTGIVRSVKLDTRKQCWQIILGDGKPPASLPSVDA
jgi:hypothetical protein